MSGVYFKRRLEARNILLMFEGIQDIAQNVMLSVKFLSNKFMSYVISSKNSLYSAKLLLHQSHTMHSDYTVTGQ